MFFIIDRNNVEKRFLKKFYINEDNECWEWNSASRGNGYGCMKIDGKTIDSHRVSYVLYVGDIEDDLLICHKCDNRKCVNPKHLFIGTKLDNNRDMFNKGRGCSGNRNGARLHPEMVRRGENVHLSKLKEFEVENILIEYYFLKIKPKIIYKKYNISKSNIYDILRGKTWKHVYAKIMAEDYFYSA